MYTYIKFFLFLKIKNEKKTNGYLKNVQKSASTNHCPFDTENQETPSIFFSSKKSNKYQNFILNVNSHKFLLFNIENLRLYQIFFSLKKIG